MRLLLVFLSFMTLTASADEYRSTFSFRKTEIKSRNRWSITEWIEQRDRMRMMDLWLALHSPSPYEFYFGGNYQLAKTMPIDNSNSMWQAYFAAYASIFGLEAQAERGTLDEKWVGLFHLRIFGYHSQATNITLQGGMKFHKRGDLSYSHPLVGVAMTIYIHRHFGFEGLYRHYFKSSADVLGTTYDGNRYEADAFIDFNFLRVYGGFFYDLEGQTMTTDFAHLIRKGPFFGVKVYF